MTKSLPNSLTLGYLTGFNSQHNTQIVCRMQIDISDKKIRASLTTRQAACTNQYNSQVITFTDESFVRAVLERPELKRLGGGPVCIPYETITTDSDDATFPREEVGTIQLFREPEKPNTLYLDAGENGYYTWIGMNEDSPVSGSFVNEDEPIGWVPWAVAGGAIALCVGAAVYTCGSCKAKIWKVEIGYTCDPD